MGNDSKIPESIKAFLIENFHSVEQLEILLLLRRQPNRSWNVPEVTAAIRTDPDSARNRLEDLHRMKFIDCEVKDGQRTYRFSRDGSLMQALDALDSYYKTHSTRIIELLYSKPSASVLNFSNSFRIWGKEK